MKTTYIMPIAACISLGSLTACNVSVSADGIDESIIVDALSEPVTSITTGESTSSDQSISDSVDNSDVILTVNTDDVVTDNEDSSSSATTDSTVVESSSFSLRIIDQNQDVVQSLEDGDSVEISDLPNFINIEAATNDDFDSVRFEASSSDFSLSRVEQLPIWTMSQEDQGFAVTEGEYTITVTGYSDSGEATDVQTLTVRFTGSSAVADETESNEVATTTTTTDSTPFDSSILDNFFFSSLADMDTYFHNVHYKGTLPELTDQEYYGKSFAFILKSWLSFYIDMHKNTGDSKWIDYAETTVDYMFSRTDDKLYERGELTGMPYYKAPQAVMEASNQTGHIGWSIPDSSGRNVEILEDGVICKYVMKVVDYVYENDIAFETNKLETWIDDCIAILKTHDSEFVFDRFAGDSSRTIVDGSYYYTNPGNPSSLWSNPVSFNHSANAGSAMYLINKYRSEPEFTAKQQAIADFMMRNFTEVNDYYSWPYGVNSYGGQLTGVLQDVNHSAYDIDFLVDMYYDGYVPEQFINRVLRTVPVFIGENSSAHFIDGSGSDDGGDRVSIYEGYFAPAKQLDTDVYNLIATNLVNYMSSSRSSLWHAQMAAAARVANLVNIQ